MISRKKNPVKPDFVFQISKRNFRNNKIINDVEIQEKMQPNLLIAAVGDISFAGSNADSPSFEVFEQVAACFKKADIVIGNLEGPLFDRNNPIKGKCTIRGCRKWAEELKAAGINIVSLANNHIMDHGSEGLLSTLDVLKQNQIIHLGAGQDIMQANKPVFIEKKGYNIALLARSSVIVSSQCYADAGNAGVAYLDFHELKKSIQYCKGNADIVILIIHWGLEEYFYPSPKQRDIAKDIINCGVNIIIGHHPHVLQGVEYINNGLVIHSLGNFLFSEFEWSMNSLEEESATYKLRLSSPNKKGIILNILYQNNNFDFKPIFTRIDKNERIVIDQSQNRIEHFRTLSTNLTYPGYKYWCKIYSIYKEWQLRIGKRFPLKIIITKIWKIRPLHIKELIGIIGHSLKVLMGKTTNPYE